MIPRTDHIIAEAFPDRASRLRSLRACLLVTCAMLVAAGSLTALSAQQTAMTAPGGAGYPGNAGAFTGGRAFVENRGQWNNPARLGIGLGRMQVWFLDTEVLYDIAGRGDRGHVLRWKIVGGRTSTPLGSERDGTYRSWVGPSGTFADVQGYRSVDYRDLRPGVDARFRLKGGKLKYDLTFEAGVDPETIRMRYDGSTGLELPGDGSLRVGTSVGEVVEERPVAFQRIDGRQVEVPVRFVLHGEEIGFSLGAYDRSRPLTIDPTVRLGSYIGGNGPDEGRGIAVDSVGNIYVVGRTQSFDFPTGSGPIRRQLDTVNGSVDIFVAKFDPTMRKMIWGTYLGGSRADDPTGGLLLTRDGHVLVAGSTLSQDLPFTAGVVGPAPTGKSDGFVLSLRQQDGASRIKLEWLTYLGGGENDSITGIALSNRGDIVLTGTTYSNDFPIPSNALWPSKLGTTSAFVYKMSGDARTRLGATFLGGDNDETAAGVVIDSRDRILITGTTTSDNFPRTQNATFPARSGGADGFVVRLSEDMAALDFGTYLGGSLNDFPTSIAVDRSDRAYITGYTESGLSTDFPITVGSSGPGSWFAARFDAGVGELQYSRFLTDAAADRGSGIAVDSSNSAFLCGITSSPTFQVINGRETPGRGMIDLAFVRLSADGAVIEQASVAGGAANDVGAPQVALTRLGDLYVTGSTFSSNFPLSRFAWDSTLNSEPGIPQPDAFVLAWSFPPKPNLVGPLRRILDTLFCENSTRDTFYLYNDGDAPLTIQYDAFRITPSSFTVELPEAPLPNITLKPGDSVMYVIRYETSEFSVIYPNDLFVGTTDSLFGKNPFVVSLQAGRYAPSATPKLNFGNTLLCQDSVMEVTLFNNGPGSVTFEQPEFMSSDSPFSIEPDATFPITVTKRGDFTHFKVRFSPGEDKAYNDTLTIAVRECPDFQLKVSLMGRGASVALEGVPDSVVFPDLSICEPQHDSVITVRNTGTARLFLTGSIRSGTGFNLIFPAGLPDTLEPNEERKIVARFLASSVGTYDAEATLSMSPCDTTYTIHFTGKRPEGSLPTVSGDTLDYGVLTVCREGIIQEPLQFVVTNTSTTSTLTLGTPIVTQPFATCNVSDPTEIPPSSSGTFRICYMPTTDGVHAGKVRIGYEIGGCRDTFELVLKGERESPALEADPPVIEIPTLSTCETSHDTTLIVRNPGSAEISVDSALTSRGLELLEPTVFPQSVAAGDSMKIRVRFEPVASGSSTERLRLYFNPCRDSVEVRVSGFTQGIVATTDSDLLQFGSILRCDPVSETDGSVAVSWTGNTDEDVAISSLRIVGSEDGFLLIDSAGIAGSVIPKGEALNIPIRMRSADSGTFTGTLELVIAPCMDTLRVDLTGRVVEPELPINGGTFGNVVVANRTPGSVTLRNDSPVALTLDTAYGPAPPFEIDFTSADLPLVIPPGDIVVLDVAFTPATAGPAADSLVLIFSGDCDYRRTVEFTGTGILPEADLEFCIRGLYSAPRLVGDTVTVGVESDRAVELDAPVDLRFVVRFDPVRFDFVGVEGGTLRMLDKSEGTAEIEVSGVRSIPADLPSIRLRLLAGDQPFALASLDAVGLLSGHGVNPALCNDSAVVSIADRCVVGSVSFGKFPNKLDRPVPNPATDEVAITFQQLEDARTLFRVWNVEGKEVLRPLESNLPGGRYTIRFDVEELPPGMYFYGIQAGSWSDAGTMIIDR